MEVRVVEISFYSPHPRPLPKGAKELLFPRRCLEAALALFKMLTFTEKGQSLHSYFIHLWISGQSEEPLVLSEKFVSIQPEKRQKKQIRYSYKDAETNRESLLFQKL